MRRILTIGLFFFTSQTIASDFNLPFVNSAGLGVAYADWASAATDASTAYTNPAGLVKLSKQQVVMNLLGITGTTNFTGSALTPPFPFPAPIAQTGTAHSKINAFAPSFYYSRPISERFAFGFNVTAPFGLGTNYPQNSIVRYAATRSEVKAIDIGPSLGFKLSDLVSFGAGLDAVYLSFTLNNMYGPPLSILGDSLLQNHLHGWGAGWHAGTLLNVSPETTIGFSYNSVVSIQTTGYSVVYPPTGGDIRRNDQETKAALPARAQLSIQHAFTKRWTGMVTAFYTNWKTFQKITMKRTVTPIGTFTPVTIPFNYSNTFDYAFGTAIQANDQWTFRAGILFLNTPSNDVDRGVADPIGKATVMTIGAHYQSSENLWYDVGIGHSFFKQMPINYANPLTSLQGYTNTQTTALGGQVTWQIS